MPITKFCTWFHPIVRETRQIGRRASGISENLSMGSMVVESEQP
jgi:hypothetical protein